MAMLVETSAHGHIVYLVKACKGMAYIVMTCIVMAYTVMTYYVVYIL